MGFTYLFEIIRKDFSDPLETTVSTVCVTVFSVSKSEFICKARPVLPSSVCSSEVDHWISKMKALGSIISAESGGCTSAQIDKDVR